MEERSLDEFVETDDDSENTANSNGGAADGEDTVGSADSEDRAGSSDVDAADSGETDDEASAENSSEPAAVEPATTTSRYEPAGQSCEACGEESTRLWVDEDRTVCRVCKSW